MNAEWQDTREIRITRGNDNALGKEDETDEKQIEGFINRSEKRRILSREVTTEKMKMKISKSPTTLLTDKLRFDFI